MEGWEKWVEPCDRLLYQCWYRVLSFISIHAPVWEVKKALEKVAEKRGGKVYWVVRNRVGRYEDFEVFPGIKMSIWFFGGRRGKNTVFARVGWWKLYLIDVLSKMTAKVLG